MADTLWDPPTRDEYDGDDEGIVDREDMPWEDEDGVVHDPLAGGVTREEYERAQEEAEEMRLEKLEGLDHLSGDRDEFDKWTDAEMGF